MALRHLPTVGDLRRTTSELFEAWATELTTVVPLPLRRALAAHPRRLCVVVEDNAFALRGGPDGELLAAGPWPAIAERLQRERRRWGPLLAAAIRVPLAKCLMREKLLPRPALSRANDLLRLDLELATPFKAEDVYWGWYATEVEEPFHASVHQVLIKRNRVEPLVRLLETARVPLIAVEVEGEDGHLLPVNLLPGQGVTLPLEAALRTLLKGCAAALLLAAAVYGGLVLYRQDEGLRRLEAEIASLSARAAELRKRQDSTAATFTQISALRVRKLEAVPVIQIWEELSRQLPDTAWVVDLRIDQNTVTFDGFAASASELLATLALSPLFKDVTFTAPVTRDQQRGVERFQIRLRTDSSRSVLRGPASGTP